jgi:hypothetical protein
MTMTSSLYFIPFGIKKDQYYMRGVEVILMELLGLEVDANLQSYLRDHEISFERVYVYSYEILYI